jgi:hypothetical protein
MLLAHGHGGGAVGAKAGLQRIDQRIGHVALVDFGDEVGDLGGGVHGCLRQVKAQFTPDVQ